MKPVVAIALLFFVHNVSATDFDFEGNLQFNKPYLFVSLGCNCWQAQAMQKAYSLRDAAFPFDWLFTLDNNKLIKCLDEKFKYFNDQSYFVRYDTIHLENTYYNFKFTHDWPYKDHKITSVRHKGQLEFIKKKYERRIARFDSLRNFQGKVFFMRCFQINPNYKGEYGWNAHNAQNLNEALKRFFPELNFTLVVVSCTDSTVSEIGSLDGIKEYKIKDLTENHFAAYSSMFIDLLAEFMPHDKTFLATQTE